jgi:hypothetical protein
MISKHFFVGAGLAPTHYLGDRNPLQYKGQVVAPTKTIHNFASQNFSIALS